LKGNSVYVNTSNYVGIGTTDPKEKLDVVGGGIRIGSTDSVNAGTIRWTGKDFEGYNGNTWVSLTKNTNNPVNGTVIQAVAGEKLNGGLTPVPVYMSKDGLIIEQTSGQEKADIYSINMYGQIFKADTGTTKIKKITLMLEKKGNPKGDIIIGLYLLYEDNIPVMEPSKKIIKNANSISNGWNEFVFESPALISPNTNYAIAVSAPNAEDDNHIKWVHSTTNKYHDGNYLKSLDFGKTWTGMTDKDFIFRIYSENRVFPCDADNLETMDFIGFAINDANVGEKITIQTDGIVCGFQDLSIGKKYYIQNIAGKIGTFPGLYNKLVAMAVNETELSIFWSDSVDKATQQEAIAGTNDSKMMTPMKTKDLISNSFIDWSKLHNIPSGLSNGDDVGITYETDPFVNSLGKSNLRCSKGQIVEYNGSNWNCINQLTNITSGCFDVEIKKDMPEKSINHDLSIPPKWIRVNALDVRYSGSYSQAYFRSYGSYMNGKYSCIYLGGCDSPKPKTTAGITTENILVLSSIYYLVKATIQIDTSQMIFNFNVSNFGNSDNTFKLKIYWEAGL